MSGYVLWGTALDRLLDTHAVRPVVLVLWPCRHDRARLRRAKLGEGSVEHVQLVEEINSVDCNPLVQILCATTRQVRGQVLIENTQQLDKVSTAGNLFRSDL